LVQVFYSRFGRVITIVVSSILLLSLVAIASSEGIEALLRSVPAIGFVIALVVSLYWLPKVVVDDGGVRIHNVLRTHYIVWDAIELIDTKYSLTITALGKKFSAWAAPAPGRHSAIFASRDQGQHLPESSYLAGTIRPGDLVTSDSGAAAAHIRRIWETKRELRGQASVASKWHLKQILILASLLVVSVLANWH
jgi:hypothetical protein